MQLDSDGLGRPPFSLKHSWAQRSECKPMLDALHIAYERARQTDATHEVPEIYSGFNIRLILLSPG